MHAMKCTLWLLRFGSLYLLYCLFFFFIVLKCQFDPILLWGIKMHVCFVM